MKMRAIVLTCALTAAACADTNTPPAQSPASATTTTASSDGDSTVATVQMSTVQPATVQAPTPPQAATARGPASDTSAKASLTPATAVFPSGTSHVTVDRPVVANNPGVADQTKNADNTKVNDRDRHGALTPMDQGNSGSETKITAAIRKGIVGDATLSFTAKNVKIITVGNKVTLRGPVKSDQEKASIEALARQTAGVGDVDDQLEVKK
jgi:hypothetical protein